MDKICEFHCNLAAINTNVNFRGCMKLTMELYAHAESSQHMQASLSFLSTYQFIIKAARFSMFCLCPFWHPPSNLPDAAPREKYRPVEGLILLSRTGVIHSDISPTPPPIVTRGGQKVQNLVQIWTLMWSMERQWRPSKIWFCSVPSSLRNMQGRLCH